MTQRTDAHRPSVIVPANYVERMWYSLAHEYEGWPQPPINIESVIEIQRAAHAAGKAMFGSIGKCGVCGAHFKHGTLFVHTPTGELVHMGYDCAAKYECLVDASAAELERDRVHRATAKAITAERNKAEREAFLDAHPGLATYLDAGKAEASALGIAADEYRILGAHAILSDLARNFFRFREMSDKQIALAAKLYEQITTPREARPVEVKAIAPTGTGKRETFIGEIVSVKLHVSEQWGSSWKCTVKVTNEDGSIWLAWGSVDRNLIDQAKSTEAADNARNVSSRSRDNGDAFERAIRAELRGLAVSVTATLEASQSRPCSSCGGSGTHTDQDYQSYKAADGTERWRSVDIQTPCKACKETGTTSGDRSFCFMKRPSMTVIGFDHPVKAKPMKGKKAKKPAPCAACAEIDESGISYQEHTCGKPMLAAPHGAGDVTL